MKIWSGLPPVQSHCLKQDVFFIHIFRRVHAFSLQSMLQTFEFQRSTASIKKYSNILFLEGGGVIHVGKGKRNNLLNHYNFFGSKFLSTIMWFLYLLSGVRIFCIINEFQNCVCQFWHSTEKNFLCFSFRAGIFRG